jgi:hypothetical protein
MKVAKDRIALCTEFTTAPTIEDERKVTERKQRERAEASKQLAKDIASFIKYKMYERRPWYKKIF